MGIFEKEKDFGDAIWSVFDKLNKMDKEAINWCENNNITVDFDRINAYREYQIGEYGIVDFLIITSHEEGVGVIPIEIKNIPLVESHASQLCRYKTGLERIIKENNIFHTYVHPILIGPSVSMSGDMGFLINHTEIDVLTYSMNPMSGISFEDSSYGWMNTDETKCKGHVFLNQVKPHLENIDVEKYSF